MRRLIAYHYRFLIILPFVSSLVLPLTFVINHSVANTSEIIDYEFIEVQTFDKTSYYWCRAFITPDLKTIVYIESQNTISFIDTYTREVRKLRFGSLDGHLEIAPNGDFLVKGRISSVSIYELPSGDLLHSSNQENLQAIAVSYDSHFVAAADCISVDSYYGVFHSYVRVWDVSNGSLVSNLEFDYFISGIYFFPLNSSIIGVCQSDNTGEEITIWDHKSNTKLRAFEQPHGDTHTLYLDPDTNKLIASHAQGIFVYDYDNPSNEVFFPDDCHNSGYGDVFECVQPIKDSTKIIAIKHSGVVSVWDIENNSSSVIYDDQDIPNKWFSSVSIAPDGSTIVLLVWYTSLEQYELVIFNLPILSESIDRDRDSINDSWETIYGLDNMNYWDRFLDNDNDSVVNILEFQRGTDPGFFTEATSSSIIPETSQISISSSIPLITSSWSFFLLSFAILSLILIKRLTTNLK